MEIRGTSLILNNGSSWQFGLWIVPVNVDCLDVFGLLGPPVGFWICKQYARRVENPDQRTLSVV